MNVIYHKILADLWGNKTRTLQVVLIIALGAFGAGTVFGGRQLTATAFNADWQRGDPPAMKISLAPAVNEATLLGLENIDGVQAVEGFQSAKIEWRRHPGEQWQAATLNARTDYTDQAISRWERMAGVWPNGNDFALEYGYDTRYGLALGDTIETRINDRVRTVKLTGLINDYEIAPLFAPDLILYTTSRRFGEMTGINNYGLLKARLAVFTPDGRYDPVRAEAIDAAVQARLDKLGIESQGQILAVPRFVRVARPDVHPGQSILSAAFLILGMIGAILVVLGALLIYLNVSAIITQQVRQIGVMKAIGARTSQILNGYLLLISAYGLLAALLSIPLAALAAHGIKLLLLTRIGVVDKSFAFYYPAMLLQLVIALSLPLLASLIPLLRGAHITVREAISSFGLGGAAGLLDALLARLHYLSYTLLLMIGNTFRNLSRVALTQAALIGAGMLFIAIVGIFDAIQYTFGPALTAIHTYDFNLNLQQDERSERLRQFVLAQPGVRAVEVWNVTNGTVRPRNQSEFAVTDERVTLYGLPLDTQMYRPHLLTGRWLQSTDANAITMHTELAGRVGVGVGDWVTLRYEGEKESTWQVVGLFFDPSADNGVYLPQPAFAWMMNRMKQGNGLYVQTADPTPAATHQAALTLKRVLEEHNIPVLVNSHPTGALTTAGIVARRIEGYTPVIGLLSFMALTVGAVGSIGLSSTLALSVMERTREIGVMRAIGASSRHILLLFVGEGLIQGIVSWLIAIPLGLPAAYFMVTRVLTTIFGDTLLYHFKPTGLLLWLTMILLLGILASWLPARKATRVSVRESLAYQ